jgi:hypothetical protein
MLQNVDKTGTEVGERGWTDSARSLLERAAARHGGWERWRRLSEVRGRIVALGGAIPVAKGIGRTFPTPARIAVRPHAWETRFDDYPEPGVDAIFSAGDVRLVDRPTGRALAESPRHRATFAGARKWRRWNPLDAVYFFGYALATYCSLPFVLERTAFVRSDRRSLTVDFPDALESHGRRQRFFFDDDGLLVRHDYRAEILSSLATGAHFSEGYVDSGGLWFATERRVTVRLGRLALPVPVLTARLADLDSALRG